MNMDYLLSFYFPFLFSFDCFMRGLLLLICFTGWPLKKTEMLLPLHVPVLFEILMN